MLHIYIYNVGFLTLATSRNFITGKNQSACTDEGYWFLTNDLSILPRFNGKDFLERFRNKRIVFVGDSISLNQWQSLTCMLHSHHRRSAFTKEYSHHGLSTFTFLVISSTTLPFSPCSFSFRESENFDFPMTND